MKKIDHFLRHNPKYSRLQKPLEAARICDAARKEARGRFEVVSFKQGLLTVGVSDSSQAANLQAESQMIINEINEKVGERAVKNIRFKIQ
ncbi:hypothetical protein A2V71_02270 [Candidatus Berkelbacteria bacterium RBG_13_40_8]|uniref:DUF721 domain-containing protein n=1 Tax=Candidatus Berkelbacteria bacterium RBG_13_40_8 TaxID=1797467 RepID=A0A1F5DPN4_9BACT|nr:MAG: hypothetical protein A2V71_02270 [Candidatus Berkelbacteria bacterium RBG_13_40_8]